jgi:hypothetical protein
MQKRLTAKPTLSTAANVGTVESAPVRVRTNTATEPLSSSDAKTPPLTQQAKPGFIKKMLK